MYHMTQLLLTPVGSTSDPRWASLILPTLRSFQNFDYSVLGLILCDGHLIFSELTKSPPVNSPN